MQEKKIFKMENHTYKPLPDYLLIDVSEIHGQGVFTKKDLDNNLLIGVTHLMIELTVNNTCLFENGLTRTPLGGHLNDSAEPNCKLVELDFKDNKIFFLTTIRDIKATEELTVDYNTTPCGCAYWR